MENTLYNPITKRYIQNTKSNRERIAKYNIEEIIKEQEKVKDITDLLQLTSNENKLPRASAASPRSSTWSPRGSAKSPKSSTKSPRGSTRSPRGPAKPTKSSAKSPKSSTKSPRGSAGSPRGSAKSPRGSAKSPKSSTKSPKSSTKSPKSFSRLLKPSFTYTNNVNVLSSENKDVIDKKTSIDQYLFLHSKKIKILVTLVGLTPSHNDIENFQNLLSYFKLKFPNISNNVEKALQFYIETPNIPDKNNEYDH